MENQKTIVVAGGGFGGAVAAVLLSKYKLQYNLDNVRIVLVDRKDYHVYYPNLYELATAEEEFTSLAQLKKSTVLPFKEFLPQNVDFIQGEITSINQRTQEIDVQGRSLHFDYLVVGLGATVDYFNIPGLAENSLTLKSVTEALRIKNACEALVEEKADNLNKEMLRIVIGGGGAIGVELAGEMANFKSILAWKYGYPAEKIDIEVIEGTNQLLFGLPKEIAHAALLRLKNIGVSVRMGSMIKSVTDKHVELSNGEVVNHNLFIWTGGVKSVEIPFTEKMNMDRKLRCMTNNDLTLNGYANIFMIGDNACVMDENNNAMPQTATQAIDHAEYVAMAIISKILKHEILPYAPTPSPFIFPIKGKWAIMRLANGFSMTGFIPWLAKLYGTTDYFAKLVGWKKAISMIWFQEKLYTRNDE